MGLNRIGNWVKVTRLVSNLQRDMEAAQQLSLKRFGLKAERIATQHISKQDLPWKALRPETVARKIRKGYSENILVETSLYFQSITSFVNNDGVFVGVKRNVRTKGGESLGNIAEIHEFGTRSGGIPARPLWRPTLEETIAWTVINNNPVDIFLKKAKRRL